LRHAARRAGAPFRKQGPNPKKNLEGRKCQIAKGNIEEWNMLVFAGNAIVACNHHAHQKK